MNSEVILEKLDCLLSRGKEGDKRQIAFERERSLVAWALLTKLPEDQLDTAWEKHGEKLSNFAKELLTLRTTTNHEMFVCYVRLVAQVVAQIPDFPSDLGICLMNAWLGTCSGKFNSVALSVDLCNTVLSWLEGDCSPSDETLILNTVWEIYANASPKSDRVIPASSHADRVHGRTYSSNSHANAEQKMKDLLSSLFLDRSDSDREHTEGNWGRLVLCIFELYGLAAHEDLVRKILFWIAEQRRDDFYPQHLQFGWHEWLMTYVGASIASSAHSTLLHEPKAMEFMQKILLAHVVFPEERALRAMAWQTITVIVHSHGWERCSNGTSTESPLCIWANLASGEWKIGLEEADDDFSSATRRPILDGCGRLLLSIIQYLATFDERPDLPTPLEPDALLHLRTSLENTLYVTSEYLNACSSFGDIDPIIMQLWSRLFSEIDVANLTAPGPIYSSLQRRLTESGDEWILHDVAALLNTAQNDEKTQVVALRLQEYIFSYLESFWLGLSDPQQIDLWLHWDIVSSACTCTELSATAGNMQSMERVRDLTIKMTQAMQFLIDYVTANTSAFPERHQLLSNLTQVTESYLSIMSKGIELTTHESRIVSHAIGLCNE